MDLLKATDISKTYTRHRALEGVSLAVPEGSVYGLLGPNGAGKTTLIRIINHITVPDCGTLEFDGRPLTAADVARIGYLPEERGLYKKMRVGDQALFFARLKGLSNKEAVERLHEWFERLEISGWWDRKVEDLSKGMAQKIQFIVTVLHRPRLLIFDEPFSGFDPINADLLKREILRLRDEGATVIFSTHNMESVEELCDHITLINQGRDILTGSVEKIRADASRGRFRLKVEGSPEPLLQALGSRLESVETTPTLSGVELIVKTRPDVQRRDLIAIANENASLLSFDRDLPSMNDIFISTVKSYNEAAQA